MDSYEAQLNEDSDRELPESINSFNNWGKIISEVKENLPAIHSDSDASSSSDDDDDDVGDVEVETFHRSVSLKSDHNTLSVERNQPDLVSSSQLLFQRLNCKHRKHQCHEPLQGDVLELPIFGELPHSSKTESKQDRTFLKVSHKSEEKVSNSASKFSYSLKGLEKFSLDDISDKLILEGQQQVDGRTEFLQTTFKDDKDSNSEKILEELACLSQVERNALKKKAKTTTSRGVTADIPNPHPFVPPALLGTKQVDRKNSSLVEPETLHIDLRPDLMSFQESVALASSSEDLLQRRSTYKASTRSSGSSDESDENESCDVWRTMRNSYKNDPCTVPSGNEKVHVKTTSTANQKRIQNSEANTLEEETKQASRALILQKVKNMKVKKLLSSAKEDVKDQFPKIEITSSPPISGLLDQDSDGIYASQRLKKPNPDILCNGHASDSHCVKSKPKSRQLSSKIKNEIKIEDNHSSQNIKQYGKQADPCKALNNSKTKESMANSNKPSQPSVPRNPTSQHVTTELKKKVLTQLEKQQLDRCSADEVKAFPLLYDSELSYEEEPKTLPDNIEVNGKNDMLLLTFKMLPNGCVLLNRPQGTRRFVPADITSGLSITYVMLISWITALIPKNLKDPFVFNEDAFRITHQSKDEVVSEYVDLVEVPFNVVHFQQAWQEDAQCIVANVIIVPNNFYNRHKNNRRKKPKKDCAFYEAVKHFLQSSRIQEVCPWHLRPESPLFFNYHDVKLSCARKPMSTYINLTKDLQMIQQVTRHKADFMWKCLKPSSSAVGSIAANNRLQTTTCLLQREALTYPVTTLDFLLRVQTSCLDISATRLIYMTRLQLNKVTLSSVRCEQMNEVVPCVVVAVRGRNIVKQLSSMIGPRDPILARMTDQGSLNALYGQQIVKLRGDDVMPTEMNVFYSPRSEERAKHQLIGCFAGRISLQNIQNSLEKSKNQAPLDLYGSESESAPRHQFLVSGSPSQVCLIISPRFSSRNMGELLTSVTQQGFVVDGLKQMFLHDKTSSIVPAQFSKYFQPVLNSDITVNEYYELNEWWRRPVTIVLLTRENAIFHRAGLLAILQSDLIYQSSSECAMMDACCQYFHLTAYTDAIAHALGPICQTINYKWESVKYFPFINSDPELEQVVVFSVVGRDAVSEMANMLQILFHEACENTIDVSAKMEAEDYVQYEEYRGFELMGIKCISALLLNQAKELIPHEVGTSQWWVKLKHYVGKPIIVCVLRRVDAFAVLRKLLQSTCKEAKHKSCKNDHEHRMMSLNTEMAFRQVSSDAEHVGFKSNIFFFVSSMAEPNYSLIQAFFQAKELFSDNENRFLLKFLPPSARDFNYNVISAPVEDNNENNKSKKKKKKSDIPRNNVENASVDSLASLLSPSYFLSSIVIIKPDAFPRHFIKILKRLHRENFKVVAAKLTVVAEDQALQIAPEKYLKMPGERRVFVSHVVSGPSVVLCVQRSNGVRKLLEVAGPLNPKMVGAGDISKNGFFTIREDLGIDEFSNAVHVSGSYSAACEEIKLFFPDGLCCDETKELIVERIPAPGVDRIICPDKMKGREVKTRLAENGISGITGMEIQPVCVLLTHGLLHRGNSPQLPAYVGLIEQLTTQGYELCALRMACLQKEQAEMACKLIGWKNSSNFNAVAKLLAGPCLLMILQRENGLILFDSIIARFLKLYPNVERDKDYLRSQTLSQTHEIARYLFNRIEVRQSVLQIGHKRMK